MRVLIFASLCMTGVLSQTEQRQWLSQNYQQLEDYNTRMGPTFDPSSCSLSMELKDDIRSYQEVIKRIFESSTVAGSAFEGKTYKDLGAFVDKFGSRHTGTEALERSIQYMAGQMEESGFMEVHTENVTVPKWLRGEEKAQLILPRKKSLAITTLGYSVPTPDEGILAEVIVVDSIEMLQTRKDEVKGKIVVYSSRNGLPTLIGASAASYYGGIAALSRSFAPLSLNTPHTGIQFYDPAIPKIPVAALSPEDADLIARLAKAGEPIKIFLRIEILSSELGLSQNVIGDFKGRERPNDLVVLSGHIDSWDVGQGALDDGVGVMLTLEAVRLLKSLQLQPRRTIRGILWTAEEMGLFGARSWAARHQAEMSQYVAALESDYGCLKAMGFIFSGKAEVGCILQEIMGLMTPADMSSLNRLKFMPTDISSLSAAGVPSILLNGNDGRYFWYHHTEADVLTTLEPSSLDTCLAVWTSLSYVIADMKEDLPRGS